MSEGKEQHQQQQGEELEEEELEEYKVLANQCKDQGNVEFERGNYEGALKSFSQAIDLDPDNHIFYSNRSACHMKLDSISKSLYDAEKCIELAPTWSKGYHRLGTAQQSLKRFQQALDTFKKGIELDPNNKSLWTALKQCEDLYAADKSSKNRQAQVEREVEEERLRKMDKLKADILNEKLRQQEQDRNEELLAGFLNDFQNEQVVATDDDAAAAPSSSASGSSSSGPPPAIGADDEDDLLASFFSDVTATTAVTVESKKIEVVVRSGDDAAAEEMVKSGGGGAAVDTADAPVVVVVPKDESSLTEKYYNQNLGSSEEQCSRLLCKHYEWRNLNPYEVLQLGADATEEDIKLRYKKLSLKVHPDRCRHISNAREAFEEVKNAYLKLTDESQKKNIVLHIESVTDEYKKERRKLLSKGGTKEKDLPNYDAELSKRVMKYFAEMENMKRRSETNLRTYNARDKMMEQEELTKQQKLSEFDKNWSEDTRRDKRIDNWREFQVDPLAKKVKASHYKEETREVKKHGVVKLETWKKSWK